MAKVGEGDSRWLVEERADGKNVNSWHWEEKSMTPWFKSQVEAAVTGAEILPGLAVERVDKFEGDASMCKRRGKLLFLFELDATLRVKGSWGGVDGVKVELRVPAWTFDEPADEAEVRVAAIKGVDDSGVRTELSRALRAEGVRAVRACLAKVAASVDEYRQSAAPKELVQHTPADSPAASPAAQPAVAKQPAGDFRSLHIEEEFACPPLELFMCLVQRDRVCAFSRGAAQVDAVPGGAFSLYDGSITGSFGALDAGERLEMAWRHASWPAGAVSQVRIRLQESKSGCVLVLDQSGVPSSQIDSMEQGWARYYWMPIRQAFGMSLPSGM